MSNLSDPTAKSTRSKISLKEDEMMEDSNA